MPEEIKNLAPLPSPQKSVTQNPLRRKHFMKYSEKIICKVMAGIRKQAGLGQLPAVRNQSSH